MPIKEHFLRRESLNSHGNLFFFFSQLGNLAEQLRMAGVCLQCGRLGSIPGLGRSSEEGNGNPFQDSCLENPMDRGAW